MNGPSPSDVHRESSGGADSAGTGVPGRARGTSATHWSLVRAAGDANSSRHEHAWDELARRHWYPLYAMARRLGKSPEDAADVTQGFLGAFLERNTVAMADPGRGRFRSFLLTCFKNYLANDRERARAQRRGGGCAPLSIDANSAEMRFAVEPATGESPDRTFDRQWALGTLERALVNVRAEYAAARKADLHDALRTMLWEESGEVTYGELATRLGMSEAAIKMAVLRLRQRCRQALMTEIARTVVHRDDLEGEYRHLIAALRS